jgi:hypothetical protein
VNIIDRILQRIKINQETGCWEWQGGVNNGGYGPHRKLYEALVGKIPSGTDVCHKCDNPKCLYPLHLFSGTRQENMDDAVKKGRMASGDRNGMRRHPEKRSCGESHGLHKHPECVARGERRPEAKLTEEAVKEIRVRYRRGLGVVLGQEFGVSHKTIHKIVHRQCWKHVA